MAEKPYIVSLDVPGYGYGEYPVVQLGINFESQVHDSSFPRDSWGHMANVIEEISAPDGRTESVGFNVRHGFVTVAVGPEFKDRQTLELSISPIIPDYPEKLGNYTGTDIEAMGSDLRKAVFRHHDLPEKLPSPWEQLLAELGIASHMKDNELFSGNAYSSIISGNMGFVDALTLLKDALENECDKLQQTPAGQAGEYMTAIKTAGGSTQIVLTIDAGEVHNAITYLNGKIDTSIGAWARAAELQASEIQERFAPPKGTREAQVFATSIALSVQPNT